MHRALRLTAVAIVCAALGALSAACPTVAHAQTDESANTSPSRADIADYFSSIRADLYTCPSSWHGAIDVAVTFTSDGHATDVALTAPEGTLPDGVRSCVSSVLRAARIRAFADPSAVVRRTIRL